MANEARDKIYMAAAVSAIARRHRGTANEARDKIYMAALRQEWPCVDWVAEHKFHPVRRWRFDFAAPAAMVAIEIEGGVWTRGRHSRGVGMVADMQKYNSAAAIGWSVIRVTPAMMEKEFPQVVLWIEGCLGGLADA